MCSSDLKGWTEGMQLVGKGGKIMLWIPSDLAYGPRGNRGIGPNEALEFEVEVLDVTPYVEPAPADSTAVAPAEKPAAEQTESHYFDKVRRMPPRFRSRISLRGPALFFATPGWVR